MKRITFSLSALLVLSALFTLTSCQKEDTSNAPQFRATMEDCTSQNGKTTLNGTALEWDYRDYIAIYGTEGRSIYAVYPTSNATVAELNITSGNPGSSPFRAFYPSTLTTDGLNITLPTSQTYIVGSINEFPMYTESNNRQLTFKNLCGALKLHLTKANTNISAISVIAADEICGTFSVDYNGGNPQLNHTSGGSNSVALTCATPQNITNGKDFYIYLPEGNYSGLQIVINTDNGLYCVKTANTSISVTRSQYCTIILGEDDLNFVEPLIEGALTGLFSISATQQVRFSQGNLQYQASNTLWRFAEHQYDYIGSANSNIGDSYSGWIDLFVWGSGNNPTELTHGSIDFVDWGLNAISNGGNSPNAWRTLTRNEWDYLFNSRNNNTNLSTSNARYAKGNVNNVYGVILFPDGYIHPNDINEPIAINNNWSNSGWANNSYTASQWAEMEANGAVFLPTAGSRVSTSVMHVGDWVNGPIDYSGYYHSSTFGLDDWGPIAISFGEYYLQTWFSIGFNSGLSVRLVHEEN